MEKMNEKRSRLDEEFNQNASFDKDSKGTSIISDIIKGGSTEA